MTGLARMEQTPEGVLPADPGWWVANLTELAWFTVEGMGTWCAFEPAGTRAGKLGIGVHILPPGETPGYYHVEDEQEGFLILRGSCLLVVEDEERTLREWDYFHCPPGTAHITIGTGTEPCAILMVGTRTGGESRTRYPANELAARHGAAVDATTDDSREAYAERPPIRPVRSPW